MAKLTLGNKANGGAPAKGKMRMFRYGLRHLTSYEYDTLDLTKLGGTEPSKHIEVFEIERFFDRAQKGKPGANYSDPRMTTGAVAFMLMENDVTEDGDFTNKFFRKDEAEPMIDKIEGGYRTWGAQSAEQESVGLQFSLRQMDADTMAYMDNSLFRMSNILWEFSPDGGRGRWFQLYDMPNRANTRITLPEPTNQIRLRAISNNPEEWVQALAVSPKLDWQNRWIDNLAWTDGDIVMDDFGYITWPEAVGGRGDVIYIMFMKSLQLIPYDVTITEAVGYEVTYGDEIEYTRSGSGQNSEATEFYTYTNYVSVEKDSLIAIRSPHPCLSVSIQLIGSGVSSGWEEVEYNEDGVYLFERPTESWSIMVKVTGSSYAANYTFYEDMVMNYYTGEVIYETRTETHYEEVEAFEEITRTKRNDLAPDEYEVPEGLTEVTIAAYDVYDDPIYKTLEL